MGWKISLVLIENKNHFSNDELLLKKAGFRTIKKVDTVDFETALGTKNKICIGNIKSILIKFRKIVKTSNNPMCS